MTKVCHLENVGVPEVVQEPLGSAPTVISYSRFSDICKQILLTYLLTFPWLKTTENMLTICQLVFPVLVSSILQDGTGVTFAEETQPEWGADVQQDHWAVSGEQTEASPSRIAMLCMPAISLPVLIFNTAGTTTRLE